MSSTPDPLPTNPSPEPVQPAVTSTMHASGALPAKPPPAQTMFVSAAPTVALDARGCIDQDIACRACGYALRGLSPNGACPECGEAVGRSILGDLLRFSDPRWVDRVAFGVRLLVIAFIISLVGGVAVGAVVLLLGFSGGASLLVIGIIFAVYLIGVSVMNIVGYWMATTRDPGIDESEQPFTARAIARWGIVAQAVVGLAALPLQFGPSLAMAAGSASPTLTLAIAAALQALSSALGTLSMVALLAYASKLAKRLPADGIARECRTIMWGYGISGAIVFVGSLCQMGAGADLSHPMMIASQVCMIVGGLPTLVFAIWAIVLLFRFNSRLGKAATQARQSWAASGARAG